MGQTKNFKVEVAKLDYLYENTQSAIISITVLSIVIFFTFRGHADQSALNVWLGLNIALSILRAILLFIYKKTTLNPHNIRFFNSMILLSVVTSALLWGIGAQAILPSDVEYQILMLLMVGGLCAGSSVSNASNIKMFYSYMFFVITPYFYIFLVEESHISNSVLIALLLYVILLLIIAKKISFNVNKNFLLAYDNRELVAKLQQKVEEANKASEAKSKFLSVMSHEIRTPLNAIIGFVKILKNNESDEEKLKYLDTVDKSSYLLMNVINDVLDVSKIESGKFSLEFTKFEPKEELESVYDLFKRSGEEKGVHVINKISESLPKCIKTDKLRLKQIISNLLSNAIKFTEKGKNVEFICSFDEKTSRLYIEVKDEGIGIAQENIENILKEFTQADSSTAREYGGTGLGLSIVSKLLKLFGSELKVHSELGKGSSFSFVLPVQIVHETKKVEYELLRADFHGEKVLVAEDNKTNQMLIKLLLEEMNLEVIMANDGLEVIELFEQEDVALVLMDINMPNKNGIEAMLQIKEQNKNIPIIALTANAIAGDKQKYLDEGFDNYLPKPIENDILLRMLKKYLD